MKDSAHKGVLHWHFIWQVASKEIMNVYFEYHMGKVKHYGQNVMGFVHKSDGAHTNV